MDRVYSPRPEIKPAPRQLVLEALAVTGGQTFEAWVRPSQFTLLELTNNHTARSTSELIRREHKSTVRRLTGALPLSYIPINGRDGRHRILRPPVLYRSIRTKHRCETFRQYGAAQRNRPGWLPHRPVSRARRWDYVSISEDPCRVCNQRAPSPAVRVGYRVQRSLHCNFSGRRLASPLTGRYAPR